VADDTVDSISTQPSVIEPVD